MSDAHLLPRTYARWLQKAEQNFHNFQASGGVALKAHVNAAEFLAWCRSLNINPDSQARMRWGNEAAIRAYRDMKAH